uniref:Uncharacterized protein n=1 Tax=viral metagenome TaxID=1070528 RepID=A0A6C0JMJ4_9ZZZZ
MSQTYKIHRWDSVIFANKGMNPIPTPIIYVKPDDELLKFAKDNSDALLVKLHAPGSIYDQKRVTGVWAKSSMIPNCREHYFEKTKLYVIVLQAPWHGYPDCLGECEIFGLTGGIPVKEINHVPLTKPDPVHNVKENFTGGKCCAGSIPVAGIAGIVMAVLVLIAAVLYIKNN